MPVGLCNALVAVFPWSAEYLREYADEKHRLQACSGLSDVRFEHIGSTAIPGMVTKPIIDIMAAVKDEEEQNRVARVLAENGYSNLGECGRPGRLFLVRGLRRCLTTHHLHLVLDGSAYQQTHVAIRDILGADAGLAAEYTALKLQLADEYPLNRMLYRFFKGSFIENRILRHHAIA